MSKYIDMFDAQRTAIIKTAKEAKKEVSAADLVEIQQIEEAYRQPEMRQILWGSFELMHQWFRGEIKPLMPQPGLHHVLKIREQPKPGERFQPYDFCTYRVNLVPSRDDWPDQRIENNSYMFNRVGNGDITTTDWKPNVAFQLTTRMREDYEGGQLAGIGPLVEVRFWGKAQPYGGIPNENTTIENWPLTEYNRDGSKKIYTGTLIRIQGEVDNPQATMRNLRSALITATPNVLAHRQIIQGQ